MTQTVLYHATRKDREQEAKTLAYGEKRREKRREEKRREEKRREAKELEE
jgi:hypothetical protein